MAVGNTFGATALSSYGGFWLAFAIIFTPGGFEIQASVEATPGSALQFLDSFGLFLMVSFPCLPLNSFTCLANMFLSGLVHLHHGPSGCNASLHNCLLLPLLHP